MTVLALVLVFLVCWTAVGLRVAHSIEPKVVKVALMVLGSALLWPLTLWTSRGPRSRAVPHKRPGARPVEAIADGAGADE